MRFKRPIPWYDVQQQLGFTYVHVVSVIVHAYCPVCHMLIGSWPEDGAVQPQRLYHGDFICPTCGWEVEDPRPL